MFLVRIEEPNGWPYAERVQRPLPAAFPEGFQPWPSQAGVIGASVTIIVEAVSTAFSFIPVGAYAGRLLHVRDLRRNVWLG